jgi:hypothetical protein
MMLTLAPRSTKEIEEKLPKSQGQKSSQNTSKNNEKEKQCSTRKEVIQSKSTTILM